MLESDMSRGTAKSNLLEGHREDDLTKVEQSVKLSDPIVAQLKVESGWG